MIPRADTEHPCESYGAPAEAELCVQCAAWIEIARHVADVRVLLEVVVGRAERVAVPGVRASVCRRSVM